MKSAIDVIHAHEILESRGNPTLNVTVMLRDGTRGSASVPSGASTGIHEALELRDGDKKRYGGKGVLKAIKNVNTKISRELNGMDVLHLQKVDDAMRLLDGTVNKHKLGANAILGVSMACAHAGAHHRKVPLYQHLREMYEFPFKKYRLPTPTMNVLNGGAHADWILDFQEFMIVPQQKKFKEKIRCGSEVFHALGGLLKAAGHSTLKGDEGGYAAGFAKNEDAFKMIVKAIKKAGYKPGKDVMLAMDPAVSEIYDPKTKKYWLKRENKKLTTKQMIAMWEKWVKKYPIVSLEDGLDQDDWDGWVELEKRLGKKVALVGDDFLVTNVERLQKCINMKAANAILIKVNQIGTISEAMSAIALAQRNKYKISVSHRSGETADTTIADIAVAVNAEYIKTGSLSRSERLSKYNRLLAIEEELKR